MFYFNCWKTKIIFELGNEWFETQILFVSQNICAFTKPNEIGSFYFSRENPNSLAPVYFGNFASEASFNAPREHLVLRDIKEILNAI